MNTIKVTIFSMVLMLALSSCKDDVIDNLDNKYTDEIANTVDGVIFKTYEELDSKAGSLESNLNALSYVTTAEQLENARQAWRDARIPWEQSEGFLFGPVDSKGIDPSIDSWPVNVEDLNAVLNSKDSLTKEYVDLLEGTLKGFHTIEWILFGESGDKKVEEISRREFEYLIACAKSLKGSTSQLLLEWSPSGGNFGTIVKSAGTGNNQVYPSQKSVLLEFSNGIITIADEVANGKIDEPFSNQNLLFEESRFSANSKNDFADNIRSIQNMYLGGIGKEGSGLSTIVKSKDQALDNEVRASIADAINAIEGIHGTFSEAVFNNKADVANAQKKVRDLLQLLESKLHPFLNQL